MLDMALQGTRERAIERNVEDIGVDETIERTFKQQKLVATFAFG